MEESWEIDNVEHFKKFFRQHIVNTENFNNEYELINNLSYNFQYLQFLTNILKSEDLHDVIKRQTIKTFIIVSASIIESILYHFLLIIGDIKKSEWTEINRQKENIYREGDDTFVKEIITYKKTEPFPIKMKFNDMINKIESKSLLKDNDVLYKSLKKIKNLRNKIHLDNIESDRDHDWNNFRKTDFIENRKCLREILKSNVFNAPSDELLDTFGFLTSKI